MGYERGLIRTDSGRFADWGNQVVDVTHPEAAGGADPTGKRDSTEAFERAIATGAREIFAPDGEYLLTRTLKIGHSQTLRGARQGLMTGDSGARILYRPTDGSIVAITHAVGARDCGIEDLIIDLQDTTHVGVRFVSSYSNFVRRVALRGTYDIGVYLYDTYVCELDQISNNGAFPRRAIIYIGPSNSTTVRRLHASCLPADPDTCLSGIVVVGGKGHTIESPVLQGVTIGISLANPLNTVIVNPYFENVVCNLRLGDPTLGSTSQATTVIGGNFAGPYAYHSQYASRGPLVYLPRADRVQLQNPKFLDTHATDPLLWPILAAGTTGQLSVYDGQFFSSTVRDEIWRDSAGASPRLTVTGAQYGSNGATEVILKADGTFGGFCCGVRVDNLGALSAVAYTPAIISGAVAPLLTGAVPVITL